MLALKQTLVGILIGQIYLLSLWAMKVHFYPGWNWRSFLLEYQIVIGALLFLSPPLISILALYSTKSALLPLRRMLSGRRSDRSLTYILFILIVFSGCLGLLVLNSPGPIPHRLEHHLVHQNWSYAEQEIARLGENNLRRDVASALMHYIDAHRRSDGNNFSSGQYHRSQRIAVKTELDAGSSLTFLNTMTYAELSKIVYFVEDRNDDELASAVQALLEAAKRASSDEVEGAFYAKVGDLMLASRRYAAAKLMYTKASLYVSNPNRQASITANLGNVHAATGAIDRAAELYRDAEFHYPEGRRDVFYSNYGYLLMLAGKYDEAEAAVRNALAINPEDWYSYLNLGLIFERKEQFNDALKNFDIVIENTDAGDYRREAMLLKAYTLIRGGQDRKIAVRVALEALGRSADSAEQVLQDADMLAELYGDAAEALRATNTHAIEEYIHFFDQLKSSVQ